MFLYIYLGIIYYFKIIIYFKLVNVWEVIFKLDFKYNSS